MDKAVPSGLKRRVVIVGCGITGASLAAILSEKQQFDVTVVEQSSADELIGSTGHAPGYVGIFNEAPILTALARESVACYRSLDNLPLLGPVASIRGLWVAAALWVTHAYGATKALGQMMAGDKPSTPGIGNLRPARFAGQPSSLLENQALRLYRDIYASV